MTGEMTTHDPERDQQVQRVVSLLRESIRLVGEADRIRPWQLRKRARLLRQVDQNLAEVDEINRTLKAEP